MKPDQMQALRAPFPASAVGKLPKVTCYQCTQNKGQCDQHRKSKCQECGNYITPAHLHLDFIGHAATTQRLLEVDPEWTWEPVSFAADGLPLRDNLGGLWIRLTVCGVTRLGYGDAAGKPGPNAVKEAIGDALRNAAMRFGVALDLWAKEDISATLPPSNVDTATGEIHETSDGAVHPEPGTSGSGAAPSEPAPRSSVPPNWTGPFLSDDGARKRMWGLLRERIGDDGEAQRAFMHGVITREWESSKDLTPYETRELIMALQAVAVAS